MAWQPTGKLKCMFGINLYVCKCVMYIYVLYKIVVELWVEVGQ
jgi:hypothetical protein